MGAHGRRGDPYDKKEQHEEDAQWQEKELDHLSEEEREGPREENQPEQQDAEDPQRAGDVRNNVVDPRMQGWWKRKVSTERKDLRNKRNAEQEPEGEEGP